MSRITYRLNDRQEYIAREMIDEFRAGHISRRAMLKTISVVCGSAAGAALLSACGDDEGAKIVADGGTDAASTTTDSAGEAAVGDTSADTAPGALSVRADDPAVEGSRVEFDSTGMAKIVGYLAKPKAAGSYPGVIVIHENRGLNDHIRDVARRLAKANFVALAPDLTSRGGSTEKLDPDMARAYLSMDGVADTLLADLNAAVTHLAAVPGVGAKLGVVGFCFGGGQTYRLAIANPKIAAAAPYYGPIQTPVIATLKDSQAAFLIHQAETDTNVNATREEVRTALMTAGKTFEIVVHPGTRHAFNNDTGAAYNEAQAVAAWTKTLDWFRTHLK